MPRPKKSETDTASIVEEKTTIETETPAAKEPEVEKVVEKKPVEKPIADDAKIVIKCVSCAGKSITLPTRTITLDENGCCEVTGIEAKRLLTIPGYERK